MKKEKSVKTKKSNKVMTSILNLVKRWAFPVILCAIIGVGIFYVVNHKDAVEEEEITEVKGYDGDGQPIVLENDALKLTLDTTTTQFQLLVKDSGKIWYSNPVNAANDPMALGTDKELLQSTLNVTHSVQSGLETVYNNYRYSIRNGLYEIQYEPGSNSVRIDYSLGDIEREYIVPPVLTVAEYQEWCGKMEKKDTRLMDEYFKKYDINKLGKKDNKEELLENYPMLETEVCYVLRETTKGKVRVTLEEIFASIGYTLEDYAEHKLRSNATNTSDKPIFGASIIYSLVGNELVVEVPVDSLTYKKDTPITAITPLPYFGAGGSEDEGFLFIPEGGGSIIHFNNGKVAQPNYAANVYGWDYGLFRDSVVHNTKTYFNTYGIANGEDSFLCILDDGAAYASIQADIGGKTHSYNFVNSKYAVATREKYDVGQIANTDIYVYLEDLPDEVFTQRYRFINSNSYVDMAKEYQNYLFEEYGDVLTKNTDTSTPVAFEIVGAVDKVRQVLGVPVSRPLKLTTYKEAAEMIKELKADGIENMSVKYTGWCNGGVQQEYLEKVKLISALGNKKDMKNLSDTASQLGVDLYLNGVTQYAYNSNLLDGFFSYSDAAKFISKERAELYEYSAVTYAAREGGKSFYLLHTDIAHQMMDNLVAEANKYKTGVSFQEVGKELASDFYKKDISYRQDVMEEQVEKLKNIKASGTKVMINLGNSYAAPYSDMITNMDLKGSKDTLIDEAVPFYQLAIHGFVNYTGYPINISGNEVDEVLLAAEYGAGLSFTFMKESAFALQKTLYTEYYGSEYAAWHDRMLDIYNRYNSELKHTFNQQMVDHDNITVELSCTTYEDGTKVYVNYGHEDAKTEDGIVVPAKDFKVIR